MNNMMLILLSIYSAAILFSENVIIEAVAIILMISTIIKVYKKRLEHINDELKQMIKEIEKEEDK